MVDIVTREKRSKMMANIGGKDTKPEMAIRKGLHALGYRYRLHVKDLPGKPDIVFTKYRAVIQINGCFWHKHNCHLFKWPSTHKSFWKKEIEGKYLRNIENTKCLLENGWRILTIWECALKGKTQLSGESVIRKVEAWFHSTETVAQIEGKTEK